ncbi:MAG: hypothetical protein RMK52_08350 [Chitinophagales bacterium]|nr:hypothetical protein [Chitinophagales bacterium]MDW8394237.1 hypothetical protein [Chitinophagales bacterium]
MNRGFLYSARSAFGLLPLMPDNSTLFYDIHRQTLPALNPPPH